MAAAFWVSIFVLVYVYIGYPALIWVLAHIPRRVQRPTIDHASLPRVTVVTAAYNEADHIAATIKNKLAADYPSELLDMIVVSDESTDGTDEIVAGFGGRVTLIRQEPRAGKTQALNAAIAATDAKIIVFSDANSLYANDAIKFLVANFADPDVGYVTGKMIYVGADGSVAGDGCTAYMRYENFIRAQESVLGAVIGVDGGVDAVRRSEYRPMRADQQPDFVLPLSVLERRLKVVYEPLALLEEQALGDSASEYRMRVRVSLRALWALWDKRRLLNPLKYPSVSLQIISHKVLRYLAFIPMLAAFVANVALANVSLIYALLLAAHVVFYAIAVYGIIAADKARNPIVRIAAYFLLVNTAAANALMRMLAGERMATWKPRIG